MAFDEHLGLGCQMFDHLGETEGVKLQFRTIQRVEDQVLLGKAAAYAVDQCLDFALELGT